MTNTPNLYYFGLSFICWMTSKAWVWKKYSPENLTEKICVSQRFDCNKDGQCKSRDICTTKTVAVQRCYWVLESSSRNYSSRNSGAQ